MKFGVREICDVVLKAKSAQKIGNKIFYKNEPVIYFDTLKTSSMEGAATTVYAQGGRGNSRLVAWEGERTVTFTMEDALISPEGFMILSGAGLVDASDKPVYQHLTETIDAVDFVEDEDGNIQIPLSKKPYLDAEARKGNLAYVMFIKDGEIVSEPYIPVHQVVEAYTGAEGIEEGKIEGKYYITVKGHEVYDALSKKEGEEHEATPYTLEGAIPTYDSAIVDYYMEHTEEGTRQIEITADKFGGNYYLEASTLFRDQNGVDMPAEFIIPNCKVQSNFTFTMASSGDPSTFTFTMDAFPDYTRFDRSKKVLAAIQIIKEAGSEDIHRHSTAHQKKHEEFFM